VGNVHQCDVNWLLDPRLVDARLRWHKGLLNIAGISDHIAELEAMWEKLSWLSEEKTLLVQMTGLIQARRDSAAASADLQEMLRRAEDALVIHWHGFMKTAADVLSEDSAEQPAHELWVVRYVTRLARAVLDELQEDDLLGGSAPGESAQKYVAAQEDAMPVPVPPWMLQVCTCAGGKGGPRVLGP